jgi:hypothetical protein
LEDAAWAEGDSPVKISTQLDLSSLRLPHVSKAKVGQLKTPRFIGNWPSNSSF